MIVTSNWLISVFSSLFCCLADHVKDNSHWALKTDYLAMSVWSHEKYVCVCVIPVMFCLASCGRLYLKGTPGKKGVLAWKCRKCANSLIVCRLREAVLSIFMQQQYLLTRVTKDRGKNGRKTTTVWLMLRRPLGVCGHVENFSVCSFLGLLSMWSI